MDCVGTGVMTSGPFEYPLRLVHTGKELILKTFENGFKENGRKDNSKCQ